MAQEFDDGEFWLPSEFLTDDDLLMDFRTDARKMDEFSIGFGNFSGFNSDLSSPSTETESDEDELTHKMTNSSINDVNFSKGVKLSGSPQSTLCGFKPGSNSVSRVSSPPEAKENVRLDLLYAAAGEVARMRMSEETAPFRNSNTIQKPKPSSSYYPNHSQAEAHLAFLQLRASHYQRLKQQQQQQMMMKNGVWWGQGKMEFHNGGKVNGDMGRTQGLSMAAWPTLQQSQQQNQQAGSRMRAVFLGETAAKKGRTGTGVFLPRRNPVENRKKPVCSTGLLPDRVVHALNLNLDSVDSKPQFRNDNGMYSQQRRSPFPQTAMNQELRFPQEWTY